MNLRVPNEVSYARASLRRRRSAAAASLYGLCIMDVDRNRINELLAHPSEGLNVEIKNWISPGEPEGEAKIVRAALGLRNRNGGYLIIGFDDKSLLPAKKNRPFNIHAISM